MIEYLVPAGMLLIFLGIIVVFAGSMLMASQQEKTSAGNTSKPKVHVGVGGFIGPIPFGFANSKTALYVTIGAAAFFFILWLILRYTA